MASSPRDQRTALDREAGRLMANSKGDPQLRKLYMPRIKRLMKQRDAIKD